MKQQFLVFVECSPGETYETAERIKNSSDIVSSIFSTSGEWDLLLRVEFEAGHDFGKALSAMLKNVGGIVRTYTFVGFPIWDPEDIYFTDRSLNSDQDIPQPVDFAEKPTPQRFLIFLECEPGKASAIGLQIAKQKKSIVRETSSISGKWDLMLHAEIQYDQEIGREVASLFKDIDGIIRTSTIAVYRLIP